MRLRYMLPDAPYCFTYTARCSCHPLLPCPDIRCLHASHPVDATARLARRHLCLPPIIFDCRYAFRRATFAPKERRALDAMLLTYVRHAMTLPAIPQAYAEGVWWRQSSQFTATPDRLTLSDALRAGFSRQTRTVSALTLGFDVVYR